MRTFYFLLVIMVLLLATTIGINAQTCTVNIGNVDPAYVGQVVNVPIYIHDFKNVGAFQLNVNFTNTVLSLEQGPNYTFNGVSVYSTDSVTANSNGKIVILWNYTGSPGGELTLADGTLMTLKFLVTSNATDSVSLTSAVVVDNASKNLLLGTTGGSVNVFSALTPTLKMQVKSGFPNVLQLYSQNFINEAGFEVVVNFPAATYTGRDTSNVSFPNSGFSAALKALRTSPSQFFMTWAYDGVNSVTLGSDGSGVLAEINFGTPLNLADLSLGTHIANTIANVQNTMDTTAAAQLTTATVSLGTVVSAPRGSVVSVPLNVTNFNNVGAFQFTISFSKASLELVANPTLIPVSTGDLTTRDSAQVNTDGKLVLAWNYSGVAGQELNFGSGTLMNLQFLVTAAASVPGSTSLTFTTTKVLNPSSQSILKSGFGSGGKIVFQASTTPRFTLGTASVGGDNKVTIPITVTNLTNLAGLDLRVNVPANFTIAGTDVTVSSAWTAASFGGNIATGLDGNGQAKVSWAYGGDPAHLATLANGTTIANLVFTYTGSATAGNFRVTFVAAFTDDINNTETKADTTNGVINLAPLPIRVNVKAFLQGPFSSGSMTTGLNSGGYLPLTQPYTGAPFSYAGTENVAAGFFAAHSTVVDWVLVQLRSTSGGAAVASAAALLKSDGTIVAVDGTSTVSIPSITTAGPYFVVVKHRNHLAIMSAAAVALSATSALYDFTTAQAQAFGTPRPMAALTGGVFGLYVGDFDMNGAINATDLSVTSGYLSQSGQAGYLQGDFTLNGAVNASDGPVAQSNSGVATAVP